MTIDLTLLNKVNSILYKPLSEYGNIIDMSDDAVVVVSSEIRNLYPETPEAVANFYVYVGCTAVINDIDILDQTQMKNSLGFAELTPILKDIFIESGNESLVPTIESSSSVFNTVYSDVDLASFGQSWGTHIEDDLKSVVKMVDKDSKSTEKAPYKNLRDYFDTMEDTAKFRYDTEVDNIVSFLRDLYESTYQLIKPKGIILPSSDSKNYLSMLTIKGKEGRVDAMEGTSNLYRNIAKNVNNIFRLTDDVEVNTTDDSFSVKAILNSNKRVFFVRPHLKLLFGRNLNSTLGESNFNQPSGQRKYPTWASAEDSVRKFVERAYQNVIIYYFRQHGKDWYDIDKENNSLADASQDFNNMESLINIEDLIVDSYKKLSTSIITSFFISEFGGTAEAPSKISIRGTFHPNNVTNEELFTAITQDSGKRITEEESVEFAPRKTIQSVPLNDLVILQFDHIFNSASANAVPLFAAKALEYIEQNIRYIKSKNPNAQVNGVSWENLLVGMNKDGFIEQGQNKVQLNKNIVHWLSAGSRAGKGVTSYNLILPQVLEDRLMFYADRKPDTVIVLAEQAGLNADGTPCMAYVNGGQFNTISPENEKYIAWQEKFLNKNRPNWLQITDRSTLDDIVYLRHGIIVLSVIEMITTKGIQQVNTTLGFDANYITGLSAVFDEYTNFQKAFLERLDPFTTQNSLLTGVLNEDIFELISDPNSDSYKSVEKKGLLKRVTLSNTWKMSLVNSLLDAQTSLASLKNAGIQTLSNIIDVMVIGQGFRGENTKFTYDLQKGKNSGEYIKGETLPGLNTKTLDPFTTLLKTIPNHDYILGTPPDSENGQNYDIIDANGKNFATYGAYLNRNYRGFAYLSKVDVDNNPTNGFVFKPFLLLNEGSEPQELKDMAKAGKIDKKQMQTAITTYQNKPGGYLAYLANEVDNIKGTSWLEIRKELKDTLGLDSNGESLAGVIPYSKKIGFNPDKYNKTVLFMNAVVKKLGYPGSYHEFVTDLRPEWMIGINDLRTGVFDGVEAFQQRSTIRGFRAFVESPMFDSNRDTIDRSLIGLNASTNPSDSGVYDNLDDLDDIPDEEGLNQPEDNLDLNNELPSSSDLNPGSSNIDGFVPGFGGIFDDIDGFTPTPEPTTTPTPTQTPTPTPDLSQTPQGQNTQSSEPVLTDTPDLGSTSSPEEDSTTSDETSTDSEQDYKPKDMTSEQQEYYFMGVKDARTGNLAFDSSSKIKLTAIGMVEFYVRGYLDGFKTSPKKLRIEYLCNSNFPEAIETASILGFNDSLDESSDLNVEQPKRKPILQIISGHKERPIDKSRLTNPRDIFKDPLIRNVPAKLGNKITQLFGQNLETDTLSSYGLKDTYIVGGKTGTISNLDVALTAPFTPHSDSNTGKYDPDKSLADYIQAVTEQIINKVGSYGQFYDITITNQGNMIVNKRLKMSFAVPKEVYDQLPWGIKRTIDAQEWGKLFSWRELSNMGDLTALTIDSFEFANSFIRPFITINYQMIDQSTLLRQYPQLYRVTIEGETVTRDKVYPDSYWSNFKLNSKSSASDMKTYTANKFNNLKNNLAKTYSNERSIRKQMRQERKDKYNSDYSDYIASADNRTERNRRKREAKLQMSKDGLKSAFQERNFRKFVSEAGYGLRVIPGVLLAKRKGK